MTDRGRRQRDPSTAARARRLPAGALLVAPGALFLAGFFVAPLLLNLGVSLQAPGGGLGAAQYGRALGDAYYLTVIAQTVGLSVAVTLGCVLFGYPLALAVARARGPMKSVLVFLVVTPLLVNVVVRTFGWMVVLGRSGAINAVVKALGLPPLDLMGGWLAIWIALVHVLLPFMVLSVASALEGIDAALEDAALTLGAGPWRCFRTVTWPLSLQGVLTGTLLVFALSMGSFVTVMMMGDTATMVLPLLVYQQLNLASDWPFAAALGMILVALVVAATVAQILLGRRPWEAARA